LRTVIGIDLGTTNSAVACMDGNEPLVIPNDRGNRITPSVVAINGPDDVLVGESAKNQAVVNAASTITAAKRAMGSGTIFTIGGRTYTPEQVCSYILRKLRKDAETFLGQTVQDAIITVPAHFSEAQRRATQEAGRLAGLRVRRLLNEPTAAALAYAYRTPGDRRILVYDLGGGTFDVTCLQKEGNTFSVLASEGDNHLGGVDFDALLLDRVLGEFERSSELNFRSEPILMQQLSEMVERAKIELSTSESTRILIPFFGGAGAGAPLHLSYEVDRNEFYGLIDALVRKTVKLTMAAVRSAGFGLRGVDSLVLSGGSSRIPLVHTYLKRALNLEQVSLVNPDEIVAMGAAIQGALLSDQSDTVHVRDVTAYNLGVEIEGDHFVTILPRNSPVPARTHRTFTTVSDRQSSVEIHVLQGEEPAASRNISLGRFLLSGIQEARRGEPRVQVSFEIDEDALVWVTARDLRTGAQQNVKVTPVSDGTGVALDMEVADRVAALVERVEQMYAEEQFRLDTEFRAEIEHTIRRASEAISGADLRALHECHLALETIIGELHVELGNSEAEQ